ncbi:MAG TPA: NAD(P)H-binding protein [Candidatus Binatia bacterium]|nr:NAD(P)H-binding protein [Candidatus Binatia bacterium]
MNLALFGATGPTGMNLLERAIAGGDTIRALARTPERLSHFRDRVTVIHGDVLDERTVAEAIVPGTDAVLSALGVPPSQRDTSFTLRRGMHNILSAMRASGTRRVLAVSASALYVDSFDNLLLRIAKPALQRLFAKMYDDLRAMDSELEGAQCDWTSVVAPQLNNKPPTGQYRVAVGHNLPRGYSITRADLAHSMFDLILDTSAFRRRVFVAN